MKTELPDWVRLQKALSIEAERGYKNLVGKQYLFNEFIEVSLRQPPEQLKAADRKKWLQIGAEFSLYPRLGFSDREKLVKNTQAFLLQMQQNITCREGRKKSRLSSFKSQEEAPIAKENGDEANGRLKVVNKKTEIVEVKVAIGNEIRPTTKSLLPREGA